MKDSLKSGLEIGGQSWFEWEGIRFDWGELTNAIKGQSVPYLLRRVFSARYVESPTLDEMLKVVEESVLKALVNKLERNHPRKEDGSFKDVTVFFPKEGLSKLTERR